MSDLLRVDLMTDELHHLKIMADYYIQAHEKYPNMEGHMFMSVSIKRRLAAILERHAEDVIKAGWQA